MKRLSIALALMLAFASNASATPSCESYMTHGCSAYTRGLSYVLQIDPLLWDTDGVGLERTAISEPQMTSIGLTEFVAGSEDVQVSSMPTLIINSIKDLKTLNDGKANISHTHSVADIVSGTLADARLADTAVTPGSYTNANLTVDSKGRITAASNGSAGSRAFDYPSRALNSCFQISSTKDADFHYSVDVTAALVLGGGTATITSYTNSGCTTGAQALRDGTVSGVVAGGTTSVNLDGSLPAGKWAKITTAPVGIGATMAIRAVQEEVVQP